MCPLRRQARSPRVVTDHDVANKLLDAMPGAARAPTVHSRLDYEPAFA